MNVTFKDCLGKMWLADCNYCKFLSQCLLTDDFWFRNAHHHQQQYFECLPVVKYSRLFLTLSFLMVKKIIKIKIGLSYILSILTLTNHGHVYLKRLIFKNNLHLNDMRIFNLKKKKLYFYLLLWQYRKQENFTWQW